MVGFLQKDGSPALGPLVIFKRTKLLAAIFLCELFRKQNTSGNSWYRTDILVCNFYTLDFMNFTPKFVPDNCLQTQVCKTRCPKGRKFKLMADVFLIKFEEKTKIKSDLPALFFLGMKPERQVYFFLAL